MNELQARLYASTTRSFAEVDVHAAAATHLTIGFSGPPAHVSDWDRVTHVAGVRIRSDEEAIASVPPRFRPRRAYRPVEPTEHDEACRRRIPGNAGDGSGHVSIDLENCERCRNLWARLDEAATRRRAQRAGCFCSSIDPRVLEGGGKCDVCQVADDEANGIIRDGLEREEGSA